MAEVRYLVVKRNEGWKVVAGSAQTGPYPDRLRAIDAAIELADRAGRDGRDSQVLVRGENNELRIEWTYGRDPFPEFIMQFAAPPAKAAAGKTAAGKLDRLKTVRLKAPRIKAVQPRRKPLLAFARLPIG